MKLFNLLAIAATAEAVMDSLSLDYYYRPCQSVTGKNAAIANLCDGQSGKKLLKCACKIDVWQMSMFECITTAADLAGTDEDSIKDSWNQVHNICGRYKVKPASYKDIKEMTEAAQITTTYAEANSTGVGPFLPNPKSLNEDTLKVALERHWQQYYSELFGMITIWYLAGIMFIQAVLHWSAYLIPGFVRIVSNNPLSRQLRRYIVLPALFNKHRAAPMKVARYFMLCFPPRLHVLFFAGYLFLSIFFLAFHYPWVDNGSTWDSYTQLVSAYLAYRSGQLGMYKMIFVFLFAGRNNVLIWLTGWQFEIFNHWHRWIARLFTIDIVIHAIGYSVDLNTTGFLHEEWTEAFMKWGGVALVAMCLLCVNGTKTMRQLAYEVFLYVHIILAVFTVVGTYYHIGVHKGIDNCWAVIGVWAFDRLIRFVRILIANPFAKSVIKAHPGGVIEVTVKYSGIWKPRAGTYIFIHFLNSRYFFQSHPFTVVPVPERGELKLYCKALNGVTRAMYNHAANNGGEVSSHVLVEGPYGVEFATKQFKEIVLLAGGIGVTAVYSHLKEIEKNGDNQIVHVHWAISNNEPLAWFKKEIDQMVAHSNVHVIIHLNEAPLDGSAPTRPDPLPLTEDEKKSLEKTESGSESDLSVHGISINKVWFCPDYNQLIADHIANSQGDIAFFVCGPAPMSDAVRAGVATNLFKTRNYVQYFEESFSM